MQFSAGMQSAMSKRRRTACRKQWIVNPLSKEAAALARSLNVSSLLAQILINRGVTDTQQGLEFLRPKLTSLIEPEKMPGVKPAVEIIADAIGKKQKITVYGDYDVDGITGVSILFELLTLLGADVDYYIPHRIDEGYGLNADAVRSLAKAGTKLLITVDCGICAVESARLAESLGLTIIITDHHCPGQQMPKAAAIVHPVLDAAYRNQNSSGSMVAFKLAWAVANHLAAGPKLEGRIREFMINATSLAAIGTIADVVDLRGENRILTSFGLKAIPSCRLPGITALIETAGLSGQGLDSFHIGFRIAPMLNAAGRMGHARLAVELLTAQSDTKAIQIAGYLKTQNSQRQQCERKILERACEIIIEKGLNHPDNKTIVLADDNWHTGVIGIVASRIVDRFYRPTIMINTSADEQKAHGSARSIPGFDILSAISACSKHLIDFGGHRAAAGVTIKPENVEKFAADFEAYANENLSGEDRLAKLHIDAVAALSEFKHQFVSQLRLLEPFGQGNPKPLFATKGVRLCAPPRKVGAKADHLQLAITDNSNSIKCIGFRFAKYEKKVLDNEYFNVAYHPQINTYKGSDSVEFVLEDIQFDD